MLQFAIFQLEKWERRKSLGGKRGGVRAEPRVGMGRRLPWEGPGPWRAKGGRMVMRWELPAPPAALHMHEVFKNDKVLFKGNSHPMPVAALWGSITPAPGSDGSLKLGRQETQIQEM